MKFNDILKRYNIVLEQEPNAAVAQTDAAMPPADQVEAPAAAEQPAQPLSSEGEVMLVRLLKKAIVLKPDDADSDTIVEMPEVNAENAKTVLQQLVTLIRKYDPDISLS